MSIRIEGLEKLVRKTKPELLNAPMRRFFTSSGIAVQRRVKQKTPVDRGRLRQSVVYEVDTRRPFPLHVIIGTNIDYAKPVEFGTGLLSDAPDSKHRRYFPPPSALDIWARRHGGGSGYQVAYAIWRRGGTRGHHMFRDGLDDSRSDIQAFLARAASEIERDWGD